MLLVLHEEEGAHAVLRGHLAAGNPLCRGTEGPIEVLAIFQGPQCYVTPSWYASKSEHGRVVPTWNYVVVHANGLMRFTRQADWLLAHLRSLTATQESHRAEPWEISDAPEDFVVRQLKGLVGFEIKIADLAGTWKVSQNRPPADRDGVRTGLLEDGGLQGAGISRLVEERGRR